MLTITKRLIYFNVFSLLLFVLALGAIWLFQVSYLPLFFQIALPILGLALIIGNAVGLYYRNEYKPEIKYIKNPGLGGLDHGIKDLRVTVSPGNIKNGTIKDFAESIKNYSSIEKVSFSWEESVNIEGILSALSYLGNTNIKSLGLWGDSVENSQSIINMLTTLPHIPENIEELDLSINVDYEFIKKLEERKWQLSSVLKATHVKKLVLSQVSLDKLHEEELKKFLELFPNVTEVKVVDDNGMPVTSKHDKYISDLMKERKALQAAQLEAEKGASGVANNRGSYVLPSQATNPAGVPVHSVGAHGDENKGEEKQGPGQGN